MSLTLRCEKREARGKNAARRLRREDKVPAVIYGPVTQATSLVLNKKDIFSVIKSETGENTIFKISFDSETKDAMIKELQVDPVREELLHVDLIQIAMDKAIRVTVSVALAGEAVGVKTEGGFVDFITRELEVECLPQNIPEQIEVNISGLHLHQSLKVEDASPPEKVRIVTDPHAIIVIIQAPAVEEEAEAKAAAEAELVATEVEPEVIKKERATEEKE